MKPPCGSECPLKERMQREQGAWDSRLMLMCDLWSVSFQGTRSLRNNECGEPFLWVTRGKQQPLEVLAGLGIPQPVLSAVLSWAPVSS